MTKPAKTTTRPTLLLPGNIPRLYLEYLPPRLLKAYENHARRHDRSARRMLRKSISQTGFVVPVLVDRHNVIIAGHQRVEIAIELGLEDIPVVRIEHLTEGQVIALRVADNRLVELGDWDYEKVFRELSALGDLDMDIEISGFEYPDFEAMMQEHLEGEEPSIPDVEDVAIARFCDLFALGDHLIYCGDSRDPRSYAALLDGELATMLFADVPYNVPINGHVGGKGRQKHREFAMASGEMTDAEYQQFLVETSGLASEHLGPGALAFTCIDWRSSSVVDLIGRKLIGDAVNLCIWAKDQPGMGSLYRSQHELIWVHKKPGQMRNNVELGKHGRNRSNVWQYPGVNGFGDQRRAERALHPTPKPVQMVADAILDCTARGDIVLDNFLGAGATLMACERTGRRARGIEIDPRYVDVVIRRWQQHTGRTAWCVTRDTAFDDLRNGEVVEDLPRLTVGRAG